MKAEIGARVKGFTAQRAMQRLEIDWTRHGH